MACPQEAVEPKMFQLTPCSKCHKEYKSCMEDVPSDWTVAPSKEQLACEDIYVSCFRSNNCQSENR